MSIPILKTAFVTLTDKSYYTRALKTIEDLRTRGGWMGDIILICVDFEPPSELLSMDIIPFSVSHIDHTPLWQIWKTKPIKKMDDNRHYAKVYQWDKLYVFSDIFLNTYDRIVFLDAGLRILDSVTHLLSLDWKETFLAPDDSDPYDNGNRFKIQLDTQANSEVFQELLKEFGEDILESRYFINCIFVFDTHPLRSKNTFNTMKEWMYKYPIMCCNEMGIMNLYMLKNKLWKPFPQRIDSGKYLFGWCELNYRERPQWNQFCFLKYPVTI